MTWRGWATYLWGFVAGAVLASYIALSCGPTQAQSADVQAAIHQAAIAEGVNVRCLHAIAYRESRYLPWVDNFQGSGAAGLMQFLPGTWRAFAGQAGYDPHPATRYDPWAAAHVAAWMIARPWTGGLRHWGGWC